MAVWLYQQATQTKGKTMSSPKFSTGQRVGILTGMQAVGGPHVSQYGTVVEVVETWADTLEYVVEAADGTRLMYRAYLLTAVQDPRAETEERAGMSVKAYRIYHGGNTRIVFATSPGQAARVVAPRVPYRTDEYGVTVVGDYLAVVVQA